MGRVVLGLHFGPPMAVFGNLMTIDSARFVRRSVPGEAGCIAQIDLERVNLCPDKGVGGKNLCLAGDLPNLPVVRMAEGKSEWVRLGQSSSATWRGRVCAGFCGLFSRNPRGKPPIFESFGGGVRPRYSLSGRTVKAWVLIAQTLFLVTFCA